MLYYTQSKEVTHMADALSKQAQFMAHDIRRPFSQIKLVLSMFNSLSSDQKKAGLRQTGRREFNKTSRVYAVRSN